MCSFAIIARHGMPRALIAGLSFLVVLPGCVFLGSYGKPSDEQIELAAATTRPASREQAMRALRQVFQGVEHAGRRIFDECRIHGFGQWSFQIACTSYKGDPASKEFRLIVEGRYAMDVPYCEPSFRPVRQFPTMAHYFFVNGFSFLGDAHRALRAYGLLSFLCRGEPGAPQKVAVERRFQSPAKARMRNRKKPLMVFAV